MQAFARLAGSIGDAVEGDIGYVLERNVLRGDYDRVQVEEWRQVSAGRDLSADV